MDQVERLIRRYQAPGVQSSVMSKLDVVMDLERVRDRRVLEFMLQILADRREPTEVRVQVLKRVRNGMLETADRPRVAGAIRDLLADRASPDLRLQATLALGEFTDVAGMVAALGALASAPEESLELRYTAFTALDRAGPTPEYLALLDQLADDEILGHSARSVLLAWAPERSVTTIPEESPDCVVRVSYSIGSMTPTARF